ncbi:PP0621 family protein [Helicobacter monodelphidis]|uniref:PP0621 family protein n=1 Tax=Helicobacter sp. 15-1451 TaxID=2004995 RepID=UPI001C6772DE|nr:PP0621 family protein [Helicobacter sp. 15-1451]
MVKWLLVVVIISGIIYFFMRNKTIGSKKMDSFEGDNMYECKQCGTYVSEREVIAKGGYHYCSPECAKSKG